MKYKKGDRVRIKGFDWYYKNSDSMGNVKCGVFDFTTLQTNYCGKTLEILSVCDDYYLMKEVGHHWTDEMIEGLANEHQEKMVNKQEFIEKACEWLNNMDNIEKYLHVRTTLVDNLAKAFRKAME